MRQDTFYQGVWWIPGKEEKKRHGTLQVSTKGESAVLDLVSPIEGDKIGDDEYDLILGVTTNECLVSLQYCLVNTPRNPFRQGKPQKLTIENVFIRKPFYREEVLHHDPFVDIKRLLVSFSYLNDWLDLPSFEFDTGIGNDNRKFFNLEYRSPGKKRFNLDILQ